MTASRAETTETSGALATAARDLQAQISSVVRGRDEVVQLALVTLFSGGHLLIEDVPGVGKTLLAKSLAASIGGSFQRVQATPDLLPTDITGTSVYQPVRGDWQFHPGPVFANVVIVDEVNRATPRTQAALLEAMEERHVTVDGDSRPLPEPFFMIATQNSREHAGTFPLPDAQLDRFAVMTTLGYPSADDEAGVLLGEGGTDALAGLQPIVEPGRLVELIDAVKAVHVSPPVADYVVTLTTATRTHPKVTVGASPRASITLLRTAQARAAMEGRDFVVPDDVAVLARPVLGHRLVLRDGGGFESGARLIDEVVGSTAVPRK